MPNARVPSILNGQKYFIRISPSPPTHTPLSHRTSWISFRNAVHAAPSRRSLSMGPFFPPPGLSFVGSLSHFVGLIPSVGHRAGVSSYTSSLACLSWCLINYSRSFAGFLVPSRLGYTRFVLLYIPVLICFYFWFMFLSIVIFTPYTITIFLGSMHVFLFCVCFHVILYFFMTCLHYTLHQHFHSNLLFLFRSGNLFPSFLSPFHPIIIYILKPLGIFPFIFVCVCLFVLFQPNVFTQIEDLVEDLRLTL